MATFDPSRVIIQANAHDTLKNDAYATGTVTIPGSLVLPANGRALYTADVTVGSAGSLADIRVQSSKQGSQDYPISVQAVFGRLGPGANPYNVYADAYHISASVMRIEAYAINPYILPISSEAGDETFTFKIRTYKAPF